MQHKSTEQDVSNEEGSKAGDFLLPLSNCVPSFSNLKVKRIHSILKILSKSITLKAQEVLSALAPAGSRMARMKTRGSSETPDTRKLREHLISIVKRKSLPKKEGYMKLLERANDVLINEPHSLRPHDRHSRPGGLVLLKQDIPTIIVPDLHARLDFFLSILFQRFSDGEDVLDKLANRTIQVVCIGDAFHGEQRAMQRWMMAAEEFRNGFKKSHHMDEEMRESLGVMEMVLWLKCIFPGYFHFLKGNHENILNEEGNGNFPFRKFALEGPMVLDYLMRFYGLDFLSRFYYFEKQLPLLATGRNFMISHAQPMHFYATSLVVGYRSHHDVIKGLTWTDNGQADLDSVEKMIDHYLADSDSRNLYYFGGHRPIPGSYFKRARGKYVQIHNPSRFTIALIRKKGEIELDRDVFEIANSAGYLVKKHKMFAPA